ncbi:uncharacterized protein H6S33_004477 [Morchella sextelata]|uniref:uncharacterized protein n=1 Tax=Morchella sextelata TaxID=1174677 RepID=UPI001D03A6B2|nr:uncharacterized protein H6S33_004477 [Morchella sextelata]KAH0606020.1 hypothetical protein H6S33_004477 [Morchella sextelata]
MHDCRTNGGHFFVHRPQGHAFRCRRCSERFVNSWSPTTTSTSSAGPRQKHPWRCIIERCEYVACDPCSSILMEELAAGGDGAEKVDEKVKGEKGGKGVGEGEGAEKEKEGVMEVDDEEEEGEGGYEPAVVCRTARQAAAEAAMKRAYVKRAPVRHGGRVE